MTSVPQKFVISDNRRIELTIHTDEEMALDP